MTTSPDAASSGSYRTLKLLRISRRSKHCQLLQLVCEDGPCARRSNHHNHNHHNHPSVRLLCASVPLTAINLSLTPRGAAAYRIALTRPGRLLHTGKLTRMQPDMQQILPEFYPYSGLYHRCTPHPTG